MTYIDSTLPTGTSSSFFIVNDLLNNATAGPSGWIMQVQFNHMTGKVADDHRVPVGGGAAINYDTWTEISATFDTDNNAAVVRYNGCIVGNGPFFVTGWNVGTGPMQIDNLDLFTIDSQIFWDNLTLTKEATPGPWFNVYNPATMAGMFANLNLSVGSKVAPAQTVVSSNTLVSVYIAAPQTPVLNAFIDFCPALPVGGGAIVLGGGQILNMNIASPTALFLYPPLGVPYAGGASTALQFNAPPGPFLATMQWFIIDPVSPSGVTLSQPCELKVL